MHVAVLIPGIMGTRLHLPDGTREAVWPPTPLEAVRGYKRLAELQRPDLLVGEIIDKVACYDFYNLLQGQLDTLGFRIGTGAKRRAEFGYDWRQDNFTTAARLAETLTALEASGATEFSLICHSMGGLIGRLVLESGRWDDAPWFGKVRLLATLGTPHLGAPLALARIFGLDSSSGLSGADFKTLAANPAYPSGYQLIPAPGEAAIWATNSPDLATLDPYDPAVAGPLGLDPGLVARAKAQYDALSGTPPAGVRYVYFAGTGHQTVTRVNVTWTAGAKVDHAGSKLTKTADGGDGTVPLYSALPARGQRQIVTNDHATVFKGLPFRKAFFRLLGGDAGAAVEAVAPVTLFGSLDSAIYAWGDRPELRLQVHSASASDGESSTTEIRGTLILDNGEGSAPVAQVPVQVQGPSVSGLTLRLDAPPAPGLYRLRFEGTPGMPVPLPFAVTEE